MPSLKNKYCEFYNLTYEECLFSLQWEALLKWMIDNNKCECLDIKKGERLNHELICEFDQYLKLSRSKKEVKNDNSM